ncbi:MAG: DUF4091 domain-containing protein [Acidobacteria bacterium]|nr:DUF4091 domain-containing protein [Acidobacteriota bacterium]
MINRTWDGQTIKLYGARNEVVSFNLVLEAAKTQASSVTVSFNSLTGPGGAAIQTTNQANGSNAGSSLFNWVGRNIELFYVRYLQIKGLSTFGWETWPDPVLPARFRQQNNGGWTSRPDHDKFYPDILVPMELVPTFNIQAGQNQSVWVDVYIPKNAPSGTYIGTVTVREGGAISVSIPVNLTVYSFALPDVPSAKTMEEAGGGSTIQLRWAGPNYGSNPLPYSRELAIRDAEFRLLHHNKIQPAEQPYACLSSDGGALVCSDAAKRLNGSAYTQANGYDGPGVNTGDSDAFFLHMYQGWGSSYLLSESKIWSWADSWVSYFQNNLPNVKPVFYTLDEPYGTALDPNTGLTGAGDVELWSKWIKADPGPGAGMTTLSTYDMVKAEANMPDVDIPVQGGQAGYDNISNYYAAAKTFSQAPHQLYFYGGARPSTGSMDTEDDGVAVRELPWAQYKMNEVRYFNWQDTPYSTRNLFEDACTWGTQNTYNASRGMTGPGNPTNGTGSLVYPGTDINNPSDNYGIDGFFASIRLKEWRRGIQDVDYLTLANQQNASAVQSIVGSVVPATLWEVPNNGGSGGWVTTPISWSSDPDVWENARAQLASIITTGAPSGGSGGSSSITVAQENSQAGSATQSVSVAFPSQVKNHGFFLVFIRMSTDTQVPVVTDSQSDTVYKMGRVDQTTDHHQSYLFYVSDAIGGSTTVKVAFQDASGAAIANGRPWVAIYELAGATAPDQFGSAIGNSASPSCQASGANAVSDEFVFAGIGMTGGSTQTVSPGTGFTLLQQATGGPRAANESRVTTAIEQSSASFSLSAPASYSCLVATFKP